MSQLYLLPEKCSRCRLLKIREEGFDICDDCLIEVEQTIRDISALVQDEQLRKTHGV